MSPKSCMQCENETLKGIKASVDILSVKVGELEEAFPDGPIKHREAHEAWIATKKAEEKFWNELKLDIAKKGVWGILVIVVGLIIIGIQIKLTGGIK